MQYMALIYTDPALTPEMGDTMNEAYFSVTQRMKAAGVFKAGDALQPSATATSVRMRGGKVETMDGPFAETKEHLGGYYLLDCADLDEQYGTVEVRPVVVYG